MSGCAGACGGRDPGCGCCEGIAAATPVALHNRAGLPALAYRVGTHGRFLASMLARLSSADHPALAGLRTRERSDWTIGLLDAWAAVADVLAFYQERIANEGYLRTATERRSVMELGRLIGYTPRPGLAATAYVAYTVEAGHRLVVPPASRVQSVPGPKELPQTFETFEPLFASGDFNSLPLRRSRPQAIAASSLAAGRQVVVAAPPGDLKPGDVVRAQLPGSDTFVLFEATAVAADPVAGTATLALATRHVVGDLPDAPPTQGTVLESKATNKTPMGQLVEALRKPPSIPPATPRHLRRDVATLLATDAAAVERLFGVLVPEVSGLLAPALAAQGQPDAAPVTFARAKVRAALFGHAAPQFPKYSDGTVTGFVDPTVTDLPVDGAADPDPIEDTSVSQFAPPLYKHQANVLLDAVYDVRPGEQVMFVNPALDSATPVTSRTVTAAEAVTVSALGLTARVTKLTLDSNWPGADDRSLSDVLRLTRVLTSAEALSLAEASIDGEDVQGSLLELDGLHSELEPGRFVVVAGERTDPEIRRLQPLAGAGTGVRGAELAMIASVEHRSGLPDGSPLPGDRVHTFLRLAQPLAYRYLRPSVVVHGNVVKATQGATVGEVLGAGDATRAFPRYPLKQPPLTYLPAPTAVGARSTLDVWVNDVRWREAEDLVGAGPTDRCYVVRTEDDGKTAVTFGDGVQGARLPTGMENVRATYRSGLGKAGNVGAGRISVAVSRPLGVKEVVNPLPATGGADRETRDQIRRNAPVAVGALDRLVSVQDYADFARTFAGIGKASAAELSDGSRQIVHVTIAGVDDAPIAPTSDLFGNLRTALVELGDPFYPLQLAVRRLKALVVAAGVHVDSDHRWDAVEPALREAMLAAFGAERRELGDDVTEAEVLSVLQRVPGVLYVQLTVLDAVDEDRLSLPGVAAGLARLRRVRAHLARPAPADPKVPGTARAILPAELAVLTPAVPDTLILTELR